MEKGGSASSRYTGLEALRACAERRLDVGSTRRVTPESDEKLLHELQVQRIELEMQNEELRRAHLALQASRDRYLALYESAPVGYFTLNSVGLISEVNMTGAELLRMDRAQLVHQRFSRFLLLEHRDLWYQTILNLLLKNDKQCCEVPLVRADGTRIHAHMDCMCMTLGDNLPVVRIAVTDISQRKQAEDELRIAAIAFETQVGMLVTDANGVIMRVNQAFSRLTGYSAEEAVGNTLALLRSERHDEAFYQNLWSTLREKGHWQGEIWNRRKSGKIYAEWMRISAVSTAEGEVTHYVGSISDITQNVEAEAEVHRLAYYDPLTQLPNRRLLLDRLGQALAASQRSGRFGAVLYLDLDHFKNLNDTRGHDVGDQLLIEVARRLHEAVREGDSLSRLGGDEFVLVLENLSTDAAEASRQAEAVGEKVRQALAKPYGLASGDYFSSTSLGVTLFHGHDATIETVLKQADLALYRAKGSGRNCQTFFSQDMQYALDEHSALEADLRQALERGELQLYFQAQFDSRRQIVGAEALLRWRHSRRGLITPSAFLAVAEESGLMLPIGRWVLRTVCAQLADWSHHAATRDLRLAVNVSARQFRQREFVEELGRTLADTGADPSRLQLELTEFVVADNVPDTIAKLQALRKLGIGVAMDNFGTGYSSLSDLKRLPLDELKIDRCFINDLTSDVHDAAIVQAIIAMGRALGLKVLAEGVETEAQLDCLKRFDDLEFQGNVFSEAVPLEVFQQYLGAATDASIA